MHNIAEKVANYRRTGEADNHKGKYIRQGIPG